MELDGVEPILTMRFEHVQLDDGEHHVIIGREGKLTKCEDEVHSKVVYFVTMILMTFSQPIRVPGAVQGFGVLVALRQEEDALVVRQVSEVGSCIV